MKKSVWENLTELCVKVITPIKWETGRVLTKDEYDILRERLAVDYYIIATSRSNYLTSFFIRLGHFLLSGRWGNYTHVLMNLEDEVETDSDFRFIEASTTGTQYSTFDDVFTGVDSVALIKPKNMTLDEWTSTLEQAKTYLGRPYDNLFNLKSDFEINCVELIRLALFSLPDYHYKFAEFEKTIAKKKRLTPDMFLECSDFEVIYEIRIK